jgi:hypothetical protein
MTIAFRRAFFTLAVLALPLALPSTVLAAQSALVAKLKQDGTIQVLTNRFQQHFADGTLVAKIETTRTDGSARIHRRSADGCLTETTLLVFGEGPLPDGSRPGWIFTSHPLSIFRCEDNGCAEEFTYGAWTASCGDFGSIPEYTIKCVCIRKNFDQVIAQGGDYCQQRFTGISVWDLTDWILPGFIQ